MMSASQKSRGRELRFIAVAVILAAYVLALSLHVMHIDVLPDDNEPGTLMFTGYEALRGLWEGIGVIPELANVALGVGVIALLVGRFKLARVMGVVGVLLALSAPFVFEVYIENLRAGYYLWLLCMLLLWIAGNFLGHRDRIEGPTCAALARL